MSAYAGSLHTICRVVFWVFRFDQILVIALYFALHFDQIPSCTQYRRNLFYFQASNEFQPFFNTDQLSCRPSPSAKKSSILLQNTRKKSTGKIKRIENESFELHLPRDDYSCRNFLFQPSTITHRNMNREM